MIPDINETMELISQNLPGWDWMLRSISDNPRDLMRGKGKYFTHIFKMEERVMVHSFKVCDDTPGSALFRAYNDAMSVIR